MENVVATGGRTAGIRELVTLRCIAGLAAAWVLSPAWAQAGPGSPPTAEARAEPPLRVEVQASELPRLEAQDTGYQSPRVDVTLFPSGARGLGAVLGVSGFDARQPQLLGLAPQRPSVDFGLRFSQKLQGQHQIDITAWRRMQASDDAYSLVQARQPVYGARFELNLTPVRKAGFSFDRGIGFQLESGARISLKRKDGRPMVYYRSTF
jgi:hypothetical protein